jgi:hypothetical protein
MSTLDLDLVREYLQVGHSGQDTVIQLLIDAAEEWAARWLGCDLEQAQHTEDVDGGQLYLAPTHRPLVEITSVTDRQTDDEYDAAEVGDLIARANADGVPLDDTLWPEGLARWRVVYYGGWADVPEGIKLGLLQLIGRAYQQRSGEASGSAAGVATNWQALAGSDILALLRPYQRIPVIS